MFFVFQLLQVSDLLNIAETGERPLIWETYITADNRTYYYNRNTNESTWHLPKANATLDPYSNPLVTPLEEWIEGPEAREFVHNAATLQVLGITNTSLWAEAAALRACFFDDARSRKRLLNLAKSRLRQMHHVGLTEDLDQSVASLAAGLSQNLNDKAYNSGFRDALSYDEEGFDMHQTFQYNSTSADNPAGEMKTVSVLEARRLGLQLQADIRGVALVLARKEPLLEELVKKEDKWLTEKEKGANILGKVRLAVRWVYGRLHKLLSADYKENIVSPWADEIIALDDEVFMLQERIEQLEQNIQAIMAIPEVKGPSTPVGKAKLIVDDTEMLENITVAEHYSDCTKVRIE